MKNKTLKTIVSILMCVSFVMTCGGLLTGCRQAGVARYNVAKEADNFNVERRISVINARTDEPLFELVGYFSISNNNNQELVVTCETGPGQYKVNYIYLNEWTLYVVEDVTGAHIDPYHYEINFLPEQIAPITFTSNE